MITFVVFLALEFSQLVGSPDIQPGPTASDDCSLNQDSIRICN